MISKLFPALVLIVLVNPNQLARDLGLDDLVDIEDRRGLSHDTHKRDDNDSRIRDMIRCSRTQNCAFFGTTFEEKDK